jgi:hypothetical protein
MKGLPEIVREAHLLHAAEAQEAYELFATYCAGPMPRVPGMATTLRLAVRIQQGRTIGEAAAREYLYRWHLALDWDGFGVPHPIGL